MESSGFNYSIFIRVQHYTLFFLVSPLLPLSCSLLPPLAGSVLPPQSLHLLSCHMYSITLGDRFLSQAFPQAPLSAEHWTWGLVTWRRLWSVRHWGSLNLTSLIITLAISLPVATFTWNSGKVCHLTCQIPCLIPTCMSYNREAKSWFRDSILLWLPKHCYFLYLPLYSENKGGFVYCYDRDWMENFISLRCSGCLGPLMSSLHLGRSP